MEHLLSLKCEHCGDIKPKTELYMFGGFNKIKHKCKNKFKKLKYNTTLTKEEFEEKYGFPVKRLRRSELQFNDGKVRYVYNRELYYYKDGKWGKVN